jgi:chaperonin GroES
MKIRPLSDRILVKKPDQGEVIAVGNGKILEDGKVRPLEVKKGDKILFGKYSGQTVKVKGEEWLVIREEDVMGVLEAA